MAAGRLSAGGAAAGGSPCFGSEPVMSPALATVAFPAAAFPAAALAAAALFAAGAASWRGAGAGPNRFDTEVGASSWLLGTGAPGGLAAASLGGMARLRGGVASACAGVSPVGLIDEPSMVKMTWVAPITRMAAAT